MIPKPERNEAFTLKGLPEIPETHARILQFHPEIHRSARRAGSITYRSQLARKQWNSVPKLPASPGELAFWFRKFRKARAATSARRAHDLARPSKRRISVPLVPKLPPAFYRPTIHHSPFTFPTLSFSPGSYIP
jgi:hypothetical protein